MTTDDAKQQIDRMLTSNTSESSTQMIFLSPPQDTTQ